MDWVVIILSLLVFNTAALFMKKRLKLSEIYTTILFALLMCVTVDVYASFRFKAWGFFQVEKAEFPMLFILLGIYPAAATMIVNWYPYESSWRKKFVYLMGWTVFSTAYEWLALKVGILWHIHWNLFYSFIIYPFLFYMLILHVRMYRWMLRLRTLNKNSTA